MAAASTLTTIAAYAAIASAAAGIASTAYAATQSGPAIPNAASSSRQVSQAQARALPTQRALAAAEQAGGAFPGSSQQMSGRELAKLRKQISRQINGLPKGSAERRALMEQNRLLGQQLKGVKGDALTTVYRDTAGNYVSPEVGGANFEGYGTADVEGQLARQKAANQIALGEKYGVPFAEEAKREAELADPEGTKARAAEYDLIQKQIENPQPISPLSTSLDEQIGNQLKAGSGFDTMSRDALEAAVMQANRSRGGGASTADLEAAMSSGNEGAARRQAGMDKAQAWLSSGATPEDVAWKREQQNLTNLGAFVGGRTPESQFQNLSGAEQGAVPYVPGQQLPQQPAGNGAAGAPYSVAAYQAGIRNQNGQANGWLAGLSSLLSGVGTAAQITK